jgi:hypothetical protein
MENENLSEKDSKAVLNYSTAVLIISPIVITGLFIQQQYGAVRFTTLMCILMPIFVIFNSKKQLSDIKVELEKRGNNDMKH